MTIPEPTARITRYSAARSASLWPGALEFCACWTRSTIWASVVSAPTAVALKRTLPLRLIDPAITASPGRLVTGTLSPVTSASSMLVSPSVTSPSTGTLSPGLRSTVSSSRTSLLGIVTSSPSRITVACGGTRSKSARRASLVPRLERISIQCPKRTKVTSMAAAS